MAKKPTPPKRRNVLTLCMLQRYRSTTTTHPDRRESPMRNFSMILVTVSAYFDATSAAAYAGEDGFENYGPTLRNRIRRVAGSHAVRAERAALFFGY